jgi:hypothetical protein
MSGKQQLDMPPVPNLGTSSVAYSQEIQNQNNGALRTFFIKLVNAIQSITARMGGRYINFPYGAFQDSTDQTAASTTVAYAITFNTTDFSNGVTLSNSSRLNVANAGLYNLQFSIQFKNTTNDGQDVDVWFRKNGTNIDNSNSRFHLVARKGTGDPSHIIAALNFFVDMAANDYVEIMWRTENTGVNIEHFGTSTSPTRPAIPSVIATMNLVGGSGSATFNGVYASSQGQGTATITHFANSTADKKYKYVVIG